ncbi:hypothetical protein L1987_62812 [Smallanthus sonchifolius]|uniref:Uncharacterized protein n=1 Tax=Smallanthus sonchifolius TaxID=185202 RepID=A0ACB9CBK6_9ASTR|nr:hypothetical protein L1987_62812 [Smallanthus sonchifolius]
MESPEGEDTVFYAELTRQILMLMDDEDETEARSEFKRRSVVRHGSWSGGLVASGGYFSWSESGRSVEVPGWMERLWAGNGGGGGGGGTGVFIPRVVAVAAAGKSRRRRRNKARKNNVNYGGIRIHG